MIAPKMSTYVLQAWQRVSEGKYLQRLHAVQAASWNAATPLTAMAVSLGSTKSREQTSCLDPCARGYSMHLQLTPQFGTDTSQTGILR